MYQKNFDEWNLHKKKIQETKFSEFVHEREVWWAAIGVNLGFEQDGKHQLFERPVLVLKKFNRDMALIIPLSTKLKNKPYCISFKHKDEEYSALISQIRLISTKRLLRKIYIMDERIFEVIRKEVKDML